MGFVVPRAVCVPGDVHRMHLARKGEQAFEKALQKVDVG